MRNVGITLLDAHLGRGAGVTTDAEYSVRVEILARRKRLRREAAFEEDAGLEGADDVESATEAPVAKLLVAGTQSPSSARSSATNP